MFDVQSVYTHSGDMDSQLVKEALSVSLKAPERCCCCCHVSLSNWLFIRWLAKADAIWGRRRQTPSSRRTHMDMLKAVCLHMVSEVEL
jgi:hypothetical protein